MPGLHTVLHSNEEQISPSASDQLLLTPGFIDPGSIEPSEQALTLRVTLRNTGRHGMLDQASARSVTSINLLLSIVRVGLPRLHPHVRRDQGGISATLSWT